MNQIDVILGDVGCVSGRIWKPGTRMLVLLYFTGEVF
jgi:hypothetical protein